MTEAGPATSAVAREIERLARVDGGRLLALLVSHLRDFQLAEDCLQDALEAAIVHWGRSGLPNSPPAWLMRTARRKAIDRLRRAASFRSKEAQIAEFMAFDRAASQAAEDEPIPDERLKLIFVCCHPALDRRTSVALTLRSICGLTTEEIARAFVVSSDAMAQRLVRARHKITRAGIAYEVPRKEAWSERLDAVLAVVYLTFNEGYAASSDNRLRLDLCREAIRLGRLSVALCPGEPEIEGLLALMLLHHARSGTRQGERGEIIPLEEQDRSLWDREAITEGTALADTALRRGRPGAYQLQAAIAALHAEAPSFARTDWRQIARLYDVLIGIQPNPVFVLNGAVAASEVEGPAAGLARLAAVEPALASYQPFHAAKADLLRRNGDVAGARASYNLAISLSGTDAERTFLGRKLAALPLKGSPAYG